MAAITFKVGVRTISAPMPTMSLQDNVNALARTYPMFRWTTILDSDAVVLPNGDLQYELILPPIKANG